MIDLPQQPTEPQRLPEWLKRKKDLKGMRELKLRLRKASLATVCEEARCPNISECFCNPTATFMIMGTVCSRNCRFCSVQSGQPQPLDAQEPVHVAEAAAELKLEHVVITSVTRDDLPDQGAGHFARCIEEVRRRLPEATVEVLTPDFGGRTTLLYQVLDARPDVFNHNIETTAGLHSSIRPQASYKRSLDVLRAAKEYNGSIAVKSGLMVGLGENEDDIKKVIEDLHEAGCDILTIGQYMQPSAQQVPARKHWQPEKFEQWADLAKQIGIGYVISGPLVRSSYQAKEALKRIHSDGI